MNTSNTIMTDEKMQIIYAPVDRIRPNPYQPRKAFDKNSLEELANSILEYGVMQPISIREINSNTYELVAGERRLRACKILGMPTIPAIVSDVNDKDSAVLALIENLQREGLNFLEEAEGYQNLIADYQLTQDELARRLGKSQSSIANKLRLLRLSPEVKKKLFESNLTERHARAILRVPDEKIQLSILEKAVEQDLNVKMTEELVQSAIDKIMNEPISQKRQNVKLYIRDIRLFTNTIKQAIDTMQKSGIPVTYTQDDQTDYVDIRIHVPLDNKLKAHA